MGISNVPVHLGAENGRQVALEDIRYANTRRMVVAVLCLSLALWAAAGLVDAAVVSVPFFVLPLALLALSSAALKLARSRLLAAQLVWQAGLALLVTAALCFYPSSFLRGFFMLLPLSAALMINWYAAAIAELVTIGLLALLGSAGLVAPLRSSSTQEIIAGGAYLGLLGWVMVESSVSLAQWSTYYTDRANRALTDARDRQIRLLQVGEDLVAANQELSRLTARYRALQQVAEQARQAKAEFVANVSHELRAPLNMIIGFAELMSRPSHTYGARTPSALLADVAVIQRNARHLARLVDDVLDLSQIEAGRMALSKELVSVQETIDDATESVRPLFDSKGLYLLSQVGGDVPPVFCDRTRIRQVLINLLSNAGRFTEQGGVQVGAELSGSEVTLHVTDTGPGVREDDRIRLFQPFEQLDGTLRREHGGTGLGLSISKRFVEMHGGRIWLDSDPGVGTRVSFTLPMDTLPTAAPHPASAGRWLLPDAEWRVRTRGFAAPHPEANPHLLVLETGATLTRLLARYAGSLSCSTVPDLDSARSTLEHSPAQALIANSPLIMSAAGLNDLMREMECLPADLPAIVCWLPGAEAAAEKLGVVAYLVKPVLPDDLLRAIASTGAPAETVLFVDDERDVLQLYARVLAGAPQRYRVWHAETGDLALDIMRERLPDLVVLDLVMPGKDGYQVLREKAADPDIRHISVIVVSARDPADEGMATDLIVVRRGNGIVAHELLALLAGITSVLGLEQSGDRALPGRALD